MKFTKEEISLCEQVAERYRKNIEYGDWYYATEPPEEKYRARIYKYRWTGMADRVINRRREIIPLWTISDCLEFLRELKSFRAYFLETYADKSTMLCVNYWDEQEKTFIKKGETPLEACLKAVLAVLEEDG